MKIEREKINSLLRERNLESVILKIDEQVFEVQIVKEIRDEHIKDGLAAILLRTEILSQSEEVATVYAMILTLEILTNIEFPEELEEKVDYFIELSEIGLLPQLFEAIGEDKMVEFSERMKEVAEEANELFGLVNIVDDGEENEVAEVESE